MTEFWAPGVIVGFAGLGAAIALLCRLVTKARAERDRAVKLRFDAERVAAALETRVRQAEARLERVAAMGPGEAMPERRRAS